MDAPIIAWGGQGRDRTARTLTRGARRSRCGLERAEISAGRRSLARHFSEPAEGARGRRFASTTAAHFFRGGQGPGGGDGGPEPGGALSQGRGRRADRLAVLYPAGSEG